jgi:hypothetical protein
MEIRLTHVVGFNFHSQAHSSFSRLQPYGGSSVDVFDSKDAFGPKYKALRDSINNAGVAFAMHTGDIKDGGSPCTELYYNRFEDLSDSLNVPSLLTLGDNEWTDCHRSGSNPVERLNNLRSRFYDKSGLTVMGGGTPIQTSSFGIAPYIENLYFIRDGIIFTLLHVVGSNNNLYTGSTCPSSLNVIDPGCKAATAEFTARDQAVNASLRAVFAKAKEQKLKGVMIVIQASFWGGDDQTCNVIGVNVKNAASLVSSGYKNFITTFINEVSNYSGQVAVINGDAHYYRNCNPTVYPNVKFIMVPGSTDISWVQVSIDSSRSPNVFVFNLMKSPFPPQPQPVPQPQYAPIPRTAPVPIPRAPVPAPNRPVPTSVLSPIKAVPITNLCSVLYKVYNGGTNEFVSNITPNGTVVNPPCKVNVEAVITCNKKLVTDKQITMTLQRTLDKKLVQSGSEISGPYFLFGNNGTDVYSGKIGKAKFNIRVQSSDAALNDILSLHRIDFRMGVCV